MNHSKPREQLDRVIVRFAGDSGDGMQLTGDRFTQESAVFGNDLVTLPNFPAEIRAPQGTIPGVSSFQIHFADVAVDLGADRPIETLLGRMLAESASERFTDDVLVFWLQRLQG